MTEVDAAGGSDPRAAAVRPPRSPERAVREALTAWAIAFVLLVAASLLYPSLAKFVATASFLYLPLFFARRRNEDAYDYGLDFKLWKKDVGLFLIVAAILTPLFFIAFWGFMQVLPQIPHHWAGMITPLNGHPAFQPRLPKKFPQWVVDHTLVVALPEEFFYRGFIQTRLRDAWPEGRTLGGARLGRAFWVTAVLFALGHLAILSPWRLAVFFPALLFGWMREKTGTVLGAALLHAFCNLLEMVLESSFLGY